MKQKGVNPGVWSVLALDEPYVLYTEGRAYERMWQETSMQCKGTVYGCNDRAYPNGIVVLLPGFIPGFLVVALHQSGQENRL